MKILHTADWHLGKKLDFISRIEEQREVLEEICALADEHHVDLVLVAGDLFDTFNPSVEATELLYKTLKKLTNNGQRPVIAIAGNHDSPDRIDSPDILARQCGILFVGYPNAQIATEHNDNAFSITKTDAGFLEIKFAHIPYPVRILATPYANELRLKQFLGVENKAEELNNVLKTNWTQLANKYCDCTGVNILTAHLYMLERGGEILEEPDGEKPIKIGNADIVYTDAIPPQIQYSALGHLHRFQYIQGHNNPVVYSSSPLCYSFSEAGQEKRVVLIHAKPNQPVQIDPLKLHKGRSLQRKRFSDIDEAITWLHANPYALVELTMVTDTFMSSQDLKRLQEAHQGIVHIIPVVTNRQATQFANDEIKLNQDIHSLFNDFFRSKYGQQPNEEINELFKEVLAYSKDLEE